MGVGQVRRVFDSIRVAGHALNYDSGVQLQRDVGRVHHQLRRRVGDTTVGAADHHRVKPAIANFGAARLVKDLNGKFSLIGGTPNDRAAAREWCSHFLHEAVIAPDPKAPTI